MDPTTIQAPADASAPDKGASSVAKALADWYMQLAQSNPGDPRQQSILLLQQAVAEIAGGNMAPDPAAGVPEGSPDAPPPDGGMPPDAPPDGAIPMDQSAVPPEEMGGPAPTLDDAAADTQAIMAEAARRRSQGA